MDNDDERDTGGVSSEPATGKMDQIDSEQATPHVSETATPTSAPPTDHVGNGDNQPPGGQVGSENVTAKSPSPSGSSQALSEADTAETDGVSTTGELDEHLSATAFDKVVFEALLMDETSTPEVDNRGRTYLHTLIFKFLALDAIERGEKHSKFVEVLSTLTKRGLDVNHVDKSQQTVLHHVVSHGNNPDVIRALLACGCRVNIKDSVSDSVLHKSVAKGYLENVECLLEGGADADITNAKKQTILHILAKAKHKEELIQTFLMAGAKVNCVDAMKQTPLHIAAKNGRAENALLLTKKGGARADIVDSSGQTALHLAAAHDLSNEVVKILIGRGADLNARDHIYLETPLHKALKFKMVDNVRALLAAGSNPNIPDVRGETALHKAMKIQNLFLWKGLMVARGDPTIVNSSGQNALQRAQRLDNKAAISIMKQYGYVH